MRPVDWAALWSPVPQESPCRVWLPALPTTAPVGRQPVAATPRAPRSLVVALTPRHAADLPLCLPRLLAQQDVRPGDRVTVDLADLGWVHPTGLELLLTALWRRVTTQGEVLLTGGTPGLRAQLESLDITPAACRTAVYGPPPAPAVLPGPVPHGIPTGMGSPPPAPLVPQQRRPQDSGHEPDSPSAARLTWSGEVNLTVDLRTQARLNDLINRRQTRTLAIDLSGVTCLSLSTLRLLLAADQRLRARGGRLSLIHPSPSVQRLLAVTRTTCLAEQGPRPALSTDPAPTTTTAAPGTSPDAAARVPAVRC